jgi:hypothetical protein
MITASRDEIRERLMAGVLTGPNGCWIFNSPIWRGSKYARLYINQRTHYAHRLSFTVNRGEIPAGMMVCHHCDTPRCIRPDHLFLGTALDNLQDAKRKGRPLGRMARGVWTHCRNGHPFAGDNLYIDPRGHRGCRTCRRLWFRRARAEGRGCYAPKLIRGEAS